MGLDMFLYAGRFLSPYDKTEEQLSKDIGALIGNIDDGYRVKMVELDLMYWRKANAIHAWFVDNVQDGVDECQESYVPKEKLIELRDLVKKVLDSRDPKVAEELLHTRSGFFFGNTTYNDWYWSDLEETLAFLEKFIPLMDTKYKDWSVYYRSSW